MISICCGLDGQNVKIEIHEERLVIIANTTKIINFCQVKAVSVKNIEKFLLKVKLDDSFAIFEFENLHLRDLIKSIFLDKIKTAENIIKNSISSNIEYSKSFKHMKSVINDKQFASSVNMHDSVYFQKSVHEITPENFFKILNQPLVDVFITMNCTITQFFNLLISSYFYDIKNQKNGFDRLISLRLREFGSGMDYATRINSHSLLNMAESSEIQLEHKVVKSKTVEFEPLYPFESKNKEYSNSYKFEFKDLVADLEIEVQKEDLAFVFDPSDFETARDLCKLTFRAPNEESMKFSEDFTNILAGKYGKDGLKYGSRLIPSFYAKRS